MADEKKISEFPGRKAIAEAVAKAVDQPKPPAVDIAGTDTGNFPREPCGTCWHWKKHPTMLGLGLCMAAPPTAFPNAQGQTLSRPVLPAAAEGCDLWDDDMEDDDEGLPVIPPLRNPKAAASR